MAKGPWGIIKEIADKSKGSGSHSGKVLPYAGCMVASVRARVCMHLQSREHAGLNTPLPWLVSNYGGLTSGVGLVWIIQDSQTQKGLLEGGRRWIGLKRRVFFKDKILEKIQKKSDARGHGYNWRLSFLTYLERTQVGGRGPKLSPVERKHRYQVVLTLLVWLRGSCPPNACFPQLPVLESWECLFWGFRCTPPHTHTRLPPQCVRVPDLGFLQSFFPKEDSRSCQNQGVLATISAWHSAQPDS